MSEGEASLYVYLHEGFGVSYLYISKLDITKKPVAIFFPFDSILKSVLDTYFQNIGSQKGFTIYYQAHPPPEVLKFIRLLHRVHESFDHLIYRGEHDQVDWAFALLIELIGKRGMLISSRKLSLTTLKELNDIFILILLSIEMP